MISYANESKNIFLADDDEDDRTIFSEVLSEICTECMLTTAENGVRLMSFLSANTNGMPDLVFLDLNMPLKNGFECLQEIRTNNDLKQLPVIIFSTTAQGSDVDRTYNMGANYYIVKPSDYTVLKKMINKILVIDWKKEFSQPAKDNYLLSIA